MGDAMEETQQDSSTIVRSSTMATTSESAASSALLPSPGPLPPSTPVVEPSEPNSSLSSRIDTPGLFSIATAKHLLGGGIAGALAKSTTAPLERVKILWQTQRMHPSHGILGTIAHVSRAEGARGLFRGNAVSILRIFPYAGIQFASYEQIRGYFLSDGRTELTPVQRLLAGSGAGVVSVVCTYPLDVIRTRLASELSAHPGEGRLLGIVHALETVFRERSYWNGLWPTLIGIVPYAGINFFLYGYLKQKTVQLHDAYMFRKEEKMAKERERKAASGIRDDERLEEKHVAGTLPVPVKLAVGGVSGLISQTVAYPLDVVRRRMQAHPGEIAYGMKDLLLNIYQKEGIIRGLFKGLSLNFVKTPPAVAISFVTYDKLKEVLHSGNSI